MIRVCPATILARYLPLCMVYGFLHALPRAYRKKHATCYKYERGLDALYVDKLGYCLAVSAAAPVLWPHYLYKDARALEIFARGIDPEDYPAFEFP